MVRQKTKTLLLISYFFPPIQSPESTLALNSIKYLSYFGWNVIVLSAKRSKTNSMDLSALSGIPNLTSVYRTHSIENIILRGLSYFKILPDEKVGWIPFAVRKGKTILKEGNINVIISRSTPATSHLVALKLKSLTKLPWIACFSDPWTQNPYISYSNKIIKKFDEHLERKVVLTADKIVVTTSQTKDLFAEKYKIEDKIEVIPNSYDPSEFPEKKINKLKNDKFTITYVGNFYGIRSPEPFFKALKLLNEEEDISAKIGVKLIGYIGKKFRHLVSEYKLENVVRLIDTVSRKDAFRHIFDSDILLLIDAPSKKESIFLPLKLIEYINTEKPILAITPKGASADVIRLTKTGVAVLPEDITGIKNAIKDYYGLYRSSKLKIKPNWPEIEKYSAKNYVKKLIDVIEELV